MVISPLADATILGYPGHMGGPNGAVTRVVIHGTVSPTVRGGARATASYFQSPGAGGLAHYVVDPAETIACCDEATWCWHAPPNPGSIGIELCDIVDGDIARWDDADHQAMLVRAAGLTAEICHRRGIPTVHIDAAELLAGQWGIPGHIDVSQAWHQSDHHDPGDGFPWDQFIALVNGTSTGGNDVPQPTDHVRRTPGPIPGSALILTADGGVEFRGFPPGTPVPRYSILANDGGATGGVYRFPWVPSPGAPPVIAYPGLPDTFKTPGRWFTDIWLGWDD